MFQSLLVVFLSLALLETKQSLAEEEAKVEGTCNPSWTPMFGSLTHVTASINYFWSVNRAHNIFMCAVPCKGNWRKIPGGLKQVDADDSEVWGVNKHDYIYKRPVDGSSGWARVGGLLKHVSASGNGYIWGVNKAENIYKCKKPCKGAWIRVGGHLRQVDGGNQFLYGVNRHNIIYYIPVDGSGGWKSPARNNRAKYITATGDNKVYIVGLDNKVYYCNAPCADGRWVRLSDDTLTQIDGSIHLLVGRNSVEHVYYKAV